jgi:tetratricopeptide (TPR) repeat protein
MKTLEPPDIFYLAAAAGWFELGNKCEARSELEKISPELREHPDVLEMEWTLASEGGEWESCIDLGEEIVRVAPDRPFGWIHRSYALHEVGRTREAWDALLPAAGKFPDVFLIPYNLACYAARMGNIDDARSWFRKAASSGGSKRVQTMALSDPDLAVLWPEIKEM